VDSPGSGEGEEGDRGAAQRSRRCANCQAGRQARNARVQLSRAPDSAGQYEGLVPGAGTGRNRELPLARLAAHLGELARAKRYAAVRAAGARGLGESGDGPALRALVGGTPGTVCGSTGDFGSRDGRSWARFGHTQRKMG